uniref:Uncharacterized protein n=1 Tax=Glossina morsitans morsitans TaxID=37546 RepID=A0A1B0FRF6_GLOMM
MERRRREFNERMERSPPRGDARPRRGGRRRNQRNNKNLVLSESNVALGFQKARLGEGKNELDEVTNNVAFHIFLYVGKGNQRNNKNLALRESSVALGLQKASEERPELGEGKNEMEAVKNKMHQGAVGKVNYPVTSLVSAGFETANGKKISISEEGHKSIQNSLREFQDDLQETDYETELKDIKARISNESMESKFRKTANSTALIANKTSFQSATRKREFQDCLQEKDCGTELKDVKDRMECKFKKNGKEQCTTRQNHRFSNG